MNSLRRIFQVATRTVAQYRQAYLVLNVLYYSLILLVAFYLFLNPLLQTQLSHSLLREIGGAFKTMPFRVVAEAYLSGNFPLAATLTFLFNLAMGAILYITLPSLIVPFAGIILGCFRATAWGVLLSMVVLAGVVKTAGFLVILVLEGQGYVLAMLAAWALGRAALRPAGVGARGYWGGYVVGLKHTALIYVFVVVFLAIAAICESFGVIYLAS
ncbi:MAG: hypothetical protein M1136_03110 [Chloroflexi bacterium]|nr:hypothetical protein [Chloroflexota bacterium]